MKYITHNQDDNLIGKETKLTGLLTHYQFTKIFCTYKDLVDKFGKPFSNVFERMSLCWGILIDEKYILIFTNSREDCSTYDRINLWTVGFPDDLTDEFFCNFLQSIIYKDYTASQLLEIKKAHDEYYS